jgi:hypothetical protein
LFLETAQHVSGGDETDRAVQSIAVVVLAGMKTRGYSVKFTGENRA